MGNLSRLSPITSAFPEDLAKPAATVRLWARVGNINAAPTRLRNRSRRGLSATKPNGPAGASGKGRVRLRRHPSEPGRGLGAAANVVQSSWDKVWRANWRHRTAGVDTAAFPHKKPLGERRFPCPERPFFVGTPFSSHAPFAVIHQRRSEPSTPLVPGSRRDHHPIHHLNSFRFRLT
jgi:hypothetical protein